MLIDQNKELKNVTAAQIIEVTYPVIKARTETGSLVEVNVSPTEKQDPLFWEEVRSILKAKLWVPMGKKYHQLIDNGWLLDNSTLSY
ncbi:hypothetical protein [Secundilactobacillus paracollinoides]|uniref:Uncharacterized protein n=1 Tax=Secundilactobacillus paracollinoides TaxID=240427 RepID=A0A1B2J133_9LACO|nr:hypothetical protein [Secundilactobacillus paracollinoides]ANZ62052.1 hypothetical protein AYR61_12290 [Secundilactobacillus paracollinoides]ANZ67997.1 hypothetical protein AYR63_13180 [Secundilactobacillus paracollinoides]